MHVAGESRLCSLLGATLKSSSACIQEPGQQAMDKCDSSVIPILLPCQRLRVHGIST